MRRTTASLLVALLAAVIPPLRADEHDARRAFAAGRFDEARHLWEPLAASGDAEAALNLGLLYDLGRGVPQDFLNGLSLVSTGCRGRTHAGGV